MDFSIQELHALEVNMLPKFLYMAIFVPPGQNPLPFSVVNRPELLKYYEKWGREGDRAFIARVDGAPAGLIWCRLFTRDFHGYGFIAEDIPEVSMSVYPEFRGKGLGTALLQSLTEDLKKSGTKCISLSVDRQNRAVHLYRRFGFQIVKPGTTDYLMRLDF